MNISRKKLIKIISEVINSELSVLAEKSGSPEEIGSWQRGDDEDSTVTSPLGIAVLGAPASGKSYVTDLMKGFSDKRINRAFVDGRNLTVDILRGQIQDKPPKEQLKYFVEAFTMLRDLSIDAPDTFSKWFNDMVKLWNGKLREEFQNIETPVAVTVDVDSDFISLNNAGNKEASIETINQMSDEDATKIIDSLHYYKDYKRVVRYYQLAQQELAKSHQKDVTYDESGDEPAKIIQRFDKLHDSDGDGNIEETDYVTDVILVHPANVATNIIQNANRVVTGGDGGRDSSAAILSAYRDLEAGKQKYIDSAEEEYFASSAEQFEKDPDIQSALTNANIGDDEDRGDKPIDVFVEVGTMEPEFAFKVFSKRMSEDQIRLFRAFVLYHANKLDLPPEAKEVLEKIANMGNTEALDILKQAVESGDYNYSDAAGIKDSSLSDYARILGGRLEESTYTYWQKILG